MISSEKKLLVKMLVKLVTFLARNISSFCLTLETSLLFRASDEDDIEDCFWPNNLVSKSSNKFSSILSPPPLFFKGLKIFSSFAIFELFFGLLAVRTGLLFFSCIQQRESIIGMRKTIALRGPNFF